MAEFVEQRGDLVMGQQRRLIANSRGEVAHQVGDRPLQLAARQAPAVAGAIHPGAATLVAAGIQIEEEAADYLTALEHLEQPRIGMPALELGDLTQLDAIQPANDTE